MALLDLKGISKSFGAQTVLRDISLSIEEGECVAIIGYSGTGKTTLVNLLAGLIKPDAGEALLDGKPITGPGLDRAVVFQNYSLLPWLNVRENIALAVDQGFPTWSAAERAVHVEKYVAMVNLTPAMTKLPRELSGGMRQRVSVARALALNSKILLLDEPLSALDALTRANLQDEISQIRQRNRSTVLWVTNDPDEALLLADRVIPLLPTSPATLGEAIPISLARPRDRRTLTSLPEFKKLRLELITRLLSAKSTEGPRSGPIAPPDLVPEDLTRINTVQFFARQGPKRRAVAPSLKTETEEAA
jgi:nitrate/nitrite transport system ATP-binding protein